MNDLTPDSDVQTLSNQVAEVVLQCLPDLPEAVELAEARARTAEMWPRAVRLVELLAARIVDRYKLTPADRDIPVQIGHRTYKWTLYDSTLVFRGVSSSICFDRSGPEMIWTQGRKISDGDPPLLKSTLDALDALNMKLSATLGERVQTATSQRDEEKIQLARATALAGASAVEFA